MGAFYGEFILMVPAKKAEGPSFQFGQALNAPRQEYSHTISLLSIETSYFGKLHFYDEQSIVIVKLEG
jgi:hypothetical protein